MMIVDRRGFLATLLVGWISTSPLLKKIFLPAEEMTLVDVGTGGAPIRPVTFFLVYEERDVGDEEDSLIYYWEPEDPPLKLDAGETFTVRFGSEILEIE